MALRSKYIQILAISTATLAGGTIGTLHNKYNQNNNNQIIDYHFHMLSPQMCDIVYKRWQSLDEPMHIEQNLNAIQLIDKMKQLNIIKSLVVSSAYLYTSQTAKYLNYNELKEQQVVQQENNYIYNECRKYPNQLISSFSIHPLKPYSIHEIHRCFKQIDNKVCKLHFSNSNVDLRNEKHLKTIKKLFQIISEYNGYILLHFDNCYIENKQFEDYENIKQYVTKFMNECVIPYKNLKILFAHLGGFGGFDRRTADIFECILDIVIKNKMDTIFFDISSVFFDEKPIAIVPALEEKDRLKKLLKRMDENNMLNQLVYGSDYPFVEQRKYIEYARQQWPLEMEKFDKMLRNERLFSVDNNILCRIFKSRYYEQLLYNYYLMLF